jgi:hypothetical protein
MKASNLTSTGSLGLTPLQWNAFSQVATGTYSPLSASFTPGYVQVLNEANGSNYPCFFYRFYVASGNLPAWIQPGAGLKIAASVTVTGTGTGMSAVSQNLTDTYVVADVDAAGQYFDATAIRSHGSRDAVAFTSALAKTALDSGSGAVTTPLVTLVIQCQQVVMVATAGTVNVAPVVDHAGNAPYSVALTPGGGQFSISAQPGSKFDLEDWQIQTGTSGTISVLFE